MVKKENKPVKIISLGGIGEIGKNLTVIEYEEDIIVVDCGLGFPDDEMLGIDLVIPDTTYLLENADRIRGIFLTHGHEDHIGALPFVLKDLHVPVYGTRLTLGILKNKLDEQEYEIDPTLLCVEAGETVKAGVFSIEFVRVNHSIADACCLAIKTPAGMIVHTGDFKIDMTPTEGEVVDLARLGEIGKKGVMLLLCESTNAERPGFTPSEKKVGESLDSVFMRNSTKRIVIATFSSNVYRVQQIINMSVRYKRKVVVTGRSLLNILRAAIDLGYMHIPDGTIIDINDINRYKSENLTIITTGSQGEPMSALSRMAFGEHDKVELGPNDMVVISANAIPGNEKLVGRIINELNRRGIGVFKDESVSLHVSGHACQEELKIMHTLLKPKYFMPIHGEYRHLCAHRDMAISLGMPANRIFVGEVGKVLKVNSNEAKWDGVVAAGNLLVDGNGVGDVGNVVLRDRKRLAEDGIIIVVVTISTLERQIIAGPDIVSRGFVYVRESEQLLDEIKALSYQAVEQNLHNEYIDWNDIKGAIKDELIHFVYARTKRSPMILPIIINL